VNERIDRKTRLQLRRAGGTASSDELEALIERLDREWSFDRLVEAEAALTGLIGLALGARLDRRLLVLPGVVSSMLLLHAIHGWYPLLPIFRRLGVRTQNEIDTLRVESAAWGFPRPSTPGELGGRARRGGVARGLYLNSTTMDATMSRAQATEGDRVRAHSHPDANRRADTETQLCLESLANENRDVIGRHIAALDREWDVERYLQMNAGIVSLAGMVLGAAVHKRFLLLPAAVFTFFFQHAAQGWCPPLPVFRRMGVRTRHEINREKYALKALRGDFDEVNSGLSPVEERDV
jgi:hypothetical protein